MAEVMEKVNEGEHFRLSPEQFKEYFLNLNLNLNLEQHPKFTVVNAATKFAHFIIQNVIARHKNEVEDFGFQTVGKVKENIYHFVQHDTYSQIHSSDEICLPKEKCELSFLELVPGCGIEVPDDDEDWESSPFNRLFQHGLGDAVLKALGTATLFPVGDEPIYFDSEEEANDLVKLHFPGDITSQQCIPIRVQFF